MDIHVGVAEMKAHLTELLRIVEQGQGPVIVERRGQPVAVLRHWTPADKKPKEHWSRMLCGITADIPDFEDSVRRIISSRNRAIGRRINLDEDDSG